MRHEKCLVFFPKKLIFNFSLKALKCFKKWGTFPTEMSFSGFFWVNYSCLKDFCEHNFFVNKAYQYLSVNMSNIRSISNLEIHESICFWSKLPIKEIVKS